MTTPPNARPMPATAALPTRPAPAGAASGLPYRPFYQAPPRNVADAIVSATRAQAEREFWAERGVAHTADGALIGDGVALSSVGLAERARRAAGCP